MIDTPKYEVLFFSNGNTAVFHNHQQVPELQKSWFLKYLEFLQENGVDPMECQFQLQGQPFCELFKTSDDSFNWEFDS